ncbi:type II toxin-antitoxin system VapC family toxin [Fibrella forsythiae]|uniref:Type II toxin-antitoxin system VapC family toxin n=1 Tax=Fibrella forsythiae TaxID=2817061 RepID=A0ABS3JUA3_9BACT|nr:type II toxin-antitoxin system VapC family toxin [Fibrella forsythiae]MBO0952981.1 type II toxin-antitoxin system VapC family toxin [Fibrella forsythiae]
MRLLLDTHILLWVLEEHPSLSPRARTLIQDANNEVFVSSVSLFEIAIKTRLGKLHTQRTSSEIQEELTQRLAIGLLPITAAHLDAYQLLPLYEDHRDPFDRLLLATAQAERLVLISDDGKFERYASLVQLIL